MLINDWMLEDDDSLRARARSLAHESARGNITAVQREQLADEEARIKSQLTWRRTVWADMEHRDLRLMNRELLIMNEWLWTKVEGLYFVLFENRWEARFEGMHIGESKRPTQGIRVIAYLLKVGIPEGGASEVRNVMEGGDTNVMAVKESSADREYVRADDLTKTTRAELKRRYQEGESKGQARAVAEYLRRLRQVEVRLAEIDLEARLGRAVGVGPLLDEEPVRVPLTDEEMDGLAKESSVLSKEKDDLQREINRGTNRHGRLRKDDPDAKAVHTAISEALKNKIDPMLPRLAAHLKAAIKNPAGNSIRYEPDDSDGDWKWNVRM